MLCTKTINWPKELLDEATIQGSILGLGGLEDKLNSDWS